MAEPVTPRLCWSRLEALPPDVLHAIVRLLPLRQVQRRARELVNGLVAGATISCHDVIDKLALHRSFPSLAELRITYKGAEQLSDASFAEFATSTLKQLASLTSLNLLACSTLGAPALAALAGSAPQLQALKLPGDGRQWSRGHDQPRLLRGADIGLPACCARRLDRRQRPPAAARPLPADGAGGGAAP
jgi:hypothetical protein